MNTPADRRELGMNQPIARRDFLNGVAIGIAAGVSTLHRAQAQSALTANEPALRTGLRGNYPAAVDEFDAIRQGKYAASPLTDAEMQEDYDLVIVGGGISGLSAAYFYRSALGPGPKILILDNHDDFGGHAKRNEFHYQGKTFIGFGGTMGIETPYPYSYGAKALIRDLGVEVERNPEFINRDLERKYGLAAGTFFDKEHFGEDRMVKGNPRLPQFFAKAPLSDAARKDLIRLHGKNPDYMAGSSAHQKRATLAKMSYQDYLLNVAKMSPDALPFFMGSGGRNNKRVDTTPALEAAEHGLVGFNGLNLELEQEFNEGSYLFHFPDGNASIARMLVRSLVPGVLPGDSMEDVVTARANYARLDDGSSPVRIRLNSTAVKVKHVGDPASAKEVAVTYVRGGQARRVRGRNCILACYNMIIPYLCAEMPAKQKEALAYCVKLPLVYTNVQISNWKAFQKLGISGFYAPGSYFSHVTMDFPVSMGNYHFPRSPEESCLLHLLRTPCEPGLDCKDQYRAGRYELVTTKFETFERHVRDQLGRALSAGGFDPDSDIEAITVNRWPHGYAYEYNELFEPVGRPAAERPCVIGRQPFGRIRIANSDADGHAYTNTAIDQGYRAVREIVGS